jgi:hypothetical protein
MAKSDKVAEAADYKIILKKASDLVPYARNTRTHSDEQVAAIMASLLEFGFTKPVLEDAAAGHIVAGHGTTMAALRLYEQGKEIRTPGGKALPKGYVPVLDCSGWSEAQRKAYVIADNAIAERAGWDTELLKIEIGDLEALNFNTSLLGFDPGDLSDMLYPGGALNVGGSGAEPDSVPDGYVEQYGVVVVCRDTAHQEEVFNKLQDEGYNVKVVTT